jgi:adenylate cyclase
MVHKQASAEFWLVDLGSANGTRLDGRRITRPCLLRDGDRIEVGSGVFTFHQRQAAPAGAGKRPAEVNATVAEIRHFESWLLVADIIGSTQFLNRRDAADSAGLTGRWLENCRRIIEAAHGTINKYLGDGIFAYWPAEGGARDDVAAALQALARQPAEADLAFRMVLHYGVAISGAAPSLGEESLAGKEVTFVFRMEDLCSALGTKVLVSEVAANRLGDRINLSPEGVHAVKGFDGEYRFFSVSGQLT